MSVSLSQTYKFNIKLTDIDMNAQHKSPFFGGGEGGGWGGGQKH